MTATMLTQLIKSAISIIETVEKSEPNSDLRHAIEILRRWL